MDLTTLGLECVRASFAALKKIKKINITENRKNVQTNADLASHSAIINVLRKSKFKLSIDSEEADKVIMVNGGNDNFLVIIDPIDNTQFYLRGENSFCSVCLMFIIDGEAKYSFVGDIVTEDIYYCDEKYAYKNNVKIRIGDASIGKKFILGYAPYEPRFSKFIKFVKGLKDCIFYNFGGQLHTVKIVSGQYDAYVEVIPEELQEFCGALIVKRAGGFVSRLDGKDIEWKPETKQTLIVARTKKIYDLLLN